MEAFCRAPWPFQQVMKMSQKLWVSWVSEHNTVQNVFPHMWMNISSSLSIFIMYLSCQQCRHSAALHLTCTEGNRVRLVLCFLANHVIYLPVSGGHAAAPRLQRWRSFLQTGLCRAALTGVSAQIPQTQRSVQQDFPRGCWVRAALLSLITLIGRSVTRKWCPFIAAWNPADLIWPEEVSTERTESLSGRTNSPERRRWNSLNSDREEKSYRVKEEEEWLNSSGRLRKLVSPPVQFKARFWFLTSHEWLGLYWNVVTVRFSGCWWNADAFMSFDDAFVSFSLKVIVVFNFSYNDDTFLFL